MVQAEVTHFRIELLSGGESVTALSQLGKIVVGDEDMCLYGPDGTNLGCTSLSQLSKIVFLHQGSEGFINVNVPGIEGTQVVRIYTMQGQLIRTATVTDGTAELPVEDMPNGTYLLQAGAQVVKFIKE